MSVARVKLGGYTARQLVELDACTRCGECVAWCPTFNENAQELTHPLGKIARLKRWVGQQYGLRARLFGARPIQDGELDEYTKGVYSCTLCARCNQVCPVQIDTRHLWVAMREQLVGLGSFPPALAHLRQTVTSRYNIAGEDNAGRLVWSENLPQVPDGLAGRPAEIVYFVGCVAAFYPLAYGIPQSLAQILEQAGSEFTTLGGEEWCCGFPLLSAGMRAEVLALARHNVAAVRAIGARTLVTTCPSCLHTWRHDYPRLLGEPLGFEVRHASELLAELVEAGEVQLGRYDHRLTYHDPCDLGRQCGVYEAPRRILQAIPGVEFEEMAENRELALCCGGGGNVEMGDPDLAAAVARRRLAQAQETGAEAIVSACQQCKRTLTGAARRERVRIRVLDITEVVWQAMVTRQA